MADQKYPYGVRYFSKTGNTKLIAEAIAEELGCTATPTGERIRGYTDVLFLGGAIYKRKLDPSILGFITRLERRNVGKIVLFGTTTTGDPCKKMHDALEDQGFLADYDFFCCKGSYKRRNEGHPDQADLENAKA
ncbi:MAG: hypothetical protein LIO56_07625, partial [Lachnospiraceae bacterium]|nr:hypothetical protein [Lachnospiraceae bacterium]